MEKESENNTKPVDLLDILLDEDNKDPIILMDESGKQLTFEQVAVIPYEVRKEKRLYCVLKPVDHIEGIADDEGNSVIRIEEDEEVAIAVFDKYYDLLEEAQKENKKEAQPAKKPAPKTAGKPAGKK